MAQYRWIAAAGVLAVGLAGCAEPQTTPRAAAHLSINGSTHAARPPACTQLQSYRTINIPDRDGQVEAVVLLSADRAIPQWVKIRNVDGFTGSFWQGGVGDAHVDVTNRAYTITGSAYGINSSNPNKVITTDFKITAEC
ncbi:lipoprotein LpqH [Mycobacterium sp. pR1184]|uniref:lipoprotein LpqH n=1 Tax=Mycobacterium sp. pR1184 TaxID=3238981 RepID=UPI00351B9FDE